MLQQIYFSKCGFNFRKKPSPPTQCRVLFYFFKAFNSCAFAFLVVVCKQSSAWGAWFGWGCWGYFLFVSSVACPPLLRAFFCLACARSKACCWQWPEPAPAPARPAAGIARPLHLFQTASNSCWKTSHKAMLNDTCLSQKAAACSSGSLVYINIQGGGTKKPITELLNEWVNYRSEFKAPKYRGW